MRLSSFLCVILIPLAAHAAETQTLYLSGHDKDDAVPWNFTCTAGGHANTPSTIRVPSNWELQGFGIFSYGVEHRGTKAKPAEPPKTVQGHYSTAFTPPAKWSGNRTFLVFEGVMTDTQASINGKSAGPKHQGGFYRFKYEVTSLLKPGQSNSLDVIVDDESADPSVNAAERRGDYFNYGGIYRPVYLKSVPPQFIDRIAVDARADGSITVDVSPDGITNANSIEAQILDAAGKPVGEAFHAAVNPQATTRIQSKLDHPDLWTAETPNLYSLELRLKSGNDVVHSIHQRFGFRTIEVRNGDGLYVNGKRILLKGSDRHSFWPDSGRCLSEQISRDDIRLMHEMNMNAVRMSHYPPDQHFLDACDDMGLYVLDEISGWHGAYDDTVGHQVVQETVHRDVNHPSILFWDNGNESGWNTKLDGDFAKLDPQHRHVLHPWAKFDNVDTKHYPDYAKLTELCAADTVYFPTEFLHGLYDGGAGAGLADYWEVIRHSKVAAGGFIWAFLDEAPKRVDLDGHLDTRGNLAPDGIVGPNREKESSFFTIKELWSPVVITDKSLPADGKLSVENRYDFTDLNQCHFSYQLRSLKLPSNPEAGFTVTAQGKLPSPDAPPGATAALPLDPAALSAGGDALAIRIEGPKGGELYTRVFALPHLSNYRDAIKTPNPPDAKADVVTDSNTLTIRAGELTLTLDKLNGRLKSAQRPGHTYTLANGPRLVTEDPGKILSMEFQRQGADLLATAKYDGHLKTVQYLVHSSGWIDIDCVFNVTGPVHFVGLGFDFPEKDVKSLKWLGDGPNRVYKNRTEGPTLGVWQNDYNDSVTGAIPWKYPEFKGYFANVRWAQYQTAQGPITFVSQQDDLFLQNFTPTFPPKELVGKTLVPYPPTSIAFLNAIPPVGTKFGDAKSMGPASQSPVGNGDYNTKLSIFFGELPR